MIAKAKSFGFTLYALAVSAVGLLSLLASTGSQIDTTHLILIISMCLLALIAPVLVAHFLPNSDPLIFPIVLFLNCIGLTQIYSVDLGIQDLYTDYTFAINSQLRFSVISIVILVIGIAFLKDHRKLRRFIYTCMAAGIICIVLPLVPGLGLEANGASVWIKLGPLGTVQPAEFAKIFLSIFFAGYLTLNAERLKSAGRRILGLQLPRVQDSGPILVVWFISLAILILQHDLGTSMLFFGLFIMMLYTATGKVSWALIGVGLFIGGAYLAMKIFAHVAARIEIWLDPFNPDIYHRAFGGSGQVVQGFFALANGSMLGTGFGQGFPGLTPFSNSDFIYSALGEELGLTGLLGILVLYLLLIERAISISLNVNDRFGKLLACGIAFSLSLQIFVVVGGVTGIIPVTGLTLPFIARGGSSLFANYMMIGILIVISNARNGSPELNYELNHTLKSSSNLALGTPLDAPHQASTLQAVALEEVMPPNR